MSAAYGQLEQHRVQADERSCPAPRVTEAPGCTCDKCHRGEARDDRDRLHCPQPAGYPERHDCVAA
jgi:hypothetical protein